MIIPYSRLRRYDTTASFDLSSKHSSDAVKSVMILPATHVPAFRLRSMRATNTPMSRSLVASICRTFPGAEVSDPWGGGHDAWKLGGKMFACIGAVMPGVSVKTDSVDTAEMLIEAGVGVRTLPRSPSDNPIAVHALAGRRQNGRHSAAPIRETRR
jgi:hypothetical protein